MVASDPVEVRLQHGIEDRPVALEAGTLAENVGRAFDLPRFIGYDVLYIRSGRYAGRCALRSAHSEALGLPPGWDEHRAHG